ncbi:MAG: hypothetical protein WEB58_09355 [Planctomycetaceae bacterium]
MRSPLPFVLFAVSIFIGFGCGDDGPPKSSIKGTVTYKGEPVKTGDISFLPDEEKGGIPTSAPIVEGKYETDPRFGIAAGTYKCSIVGYHQKTPPAEGTGDADYHPSGIPDPTGILSREFYIPEKYNTKTELEPITVTGTEGTIEKNFDLAE